MIKRKNVFDDEWVYKAYDRWINDPYVFTVSYFARARFYDFVIACVKHVKYQNPFIRKEEAWKSINMDTLREHLEADLAKLRDENYDLYEERLHEILVNFETLIEYEKIRYSHGLK